MWAAQFLKFDKPSRWMNSGGLGTMGFGLPAAMGVQIAHPGRAGDRRRRRSLDHDVHPGALDRAQYHLPIKIFILNNHYMGMVRQWQELLHGGRYSECYMDALPDFVKLAEAFGAVGMRCDEPAKLDDTIKEMIEIRKPVIVDVAVDKTENCFPMIPSGAAHYEMLLGPGRPRRQAGVRRRHGAGVSNRELESSHTISVLVDNEPGILARVVGLFSGRGYNIESLTVAETDAAENLSRITIVTAGTPMVIEQIKAQLDRLVPVHKVHDLTWRARTSSASWR